MKWRDWKMHLMWEVEPNEGPIKLETPYLFNLVKDPKEETDANMEEGWVRGPIRRLIEAFQESLKAHPPIPPGAPDGFVPGGESGRMRRLFRFSRGAACSRPSRARRRTGRASPSASSCRFWPSPHCREIARAARRAHAEGAGLQGGVGAFRSPARAFCDRPLLR